jgi:phage regulator Rha-like protein
MQLTTIENQTTMASREIADLTGKEISHIHRDIRVMLDDLKDDPEVDHVLEDKDARGYTTCFRLPKGLTMTLVAGYSTKLRKAIIDRWQELEAQGVKPMSVLPQTYIEALEQLLIAKRAEQLAIETKAEIGHRREATAMNTASQAVKKATKLEIELDKAKEYATVKRMEMQYHGQKFNWRLLKETSQLLEIPSVTVFDANYGTVRAYHAVVWQEAYALDIL